MAQMEGKDNTLLEVVRELEKGVERLMQVLGINVIQEKKRASPSITPHGAAEEKVQDVIYRLGAVRSHVADSADFAQRLIKAIGE